jgi:hypothetical protein
MVKLRKFVVLTVEGKEEPWEHLPVPATRSWDAGLAAIVDTRAAGSNVRPQDEPRLWAEAEYVDSAGESSDAEARRDETEPCVRCGHAGHMAENCYVFDRDRGATHCREANVHVNLGASGAATTLTKRGTDIVRMPADGSCLFHGLTRGLELAGVDASATRGELMDWIAANGDVVVSDVPLRTWIRWESDRRWSVEDYTQWMRSSLRWGGAIEMAACSVAHNVSVHVWKDAGRNFVRIATFEREPTRPVLHLLWVAGRHYDVLVLARPRSRTSL